MVHTLTTRAPCIATNVAVAGTMYGFGLVMTPCVMLVMRRGSDYLPKKSVPERLALQPATVLMNKVPPVLTQTTIPMTKAPLPQGPLLTQPMITNKMQPPLGAPGLNPRPA